MTILPRIRASQGEDIGVEIDVGFPDVSTNPKAYLDADSAAGDLTLSCDGTDFSVSQFLVIGNPGNEKTEIVQVHPATAPTSTAVALVSGAVFPHNRGDLVRFIPYNKIRLFYSTDGVNFSTESPDYAIRADASETYHQRPNDDNTYSYYVKFVNATTGLLSSASDTVPAAGFSDNSIGSVKARALRQLGEKLSDLVTNQDLNDWLQEGRRTLDQNPAAFRWSFRTKFGNVTGQMLSGQWRIAVPTDLRDKNTYKNILSIRCANQNRPVVYQDRVRFNQNYLNVNHTTNPSSISAHATSIVLASTHDLDASGALTVANNSVGDGLISITYTANNRATNTLSGIPASGAGSIGRTISASTDFWQRGIFGLPTGYTIDAGYIYFDVPLKIDYDGMDVKDDHYSVIPTITTDSQAFDEPFYDLYVPWLKWKIKYKKANGKIDRDGDPDYKDWITGVATVIGQETPGQRINFIPDIEGFLSATE